MYYLSITRDSITKNRNFGAGCILVCHLLGLDFEDFHPVRNIKEFDYFKIQQIAVFRFLMKYAEEVYSKTCELIALAAKQANRMYQICVELILNQQSRRNETSSSKRRYVLGTMDTRNSLNRFQSCKDLQKV